MKTPKLKLAVIAVAAAFSGQAYGIDFLQTYRLARQNDAAFSAARSSLEAGLEKLPQGRALLLPVINGTANTNWNDGENRSTGNSRQFNSNGWNVTLTQPLFRWQNLVQYKQSQFQVLQSEAQFGQATQDLIVRVAQAYFDVLAAQDNIDFIISNKIAIGEQLAQAKRNFEVGTATITDTNEAQARYDLAVAQEISGQNALEVAVRALQQIIGQIPDKLTPLKAVAMTTPSPNVMDEWANAARRNNFVVRGNEAVFEIATQEIERQKAGHYPTLDVVASAQENTNENLAAAAAISGGSRATISQNAIGLQLALPIFAGGSVLSRTREAVALREKARGDLEASKRAAEFNARQSYLNVTNGLAQVKALEQALVSSETALQSNRVGYEVGVRINIDVLNAQQQVFQTKRDLARARYDTILNGLRLKSAAGSLTENDVELVNALLGFEPGQTPGPVPTQPMKPPTGMMDSPLQPAAAPTAKAAEPAAEKASTAAPAAPAKGAAARGAASGKTAAPAKTTASRAEPAMTQAEPASAAPTAPATASAAPAPTAPMAPTATTAPTAPMAPTATTAPTATMAPAATETAPTAVTPVTASPAPAEKALETPVPAEKAVEALQPEVAAAPPPEQPHATEPAIVPVALQPTPVLEKALPAAETAALIPDAKAAPKKASAKTATKSASSKGKNPARDGAAATQALAEAVMAAPPASTPPSQVADEPPVRVYSVVEPKIPNIAGASGPAAEPKQD
jgi:outer membrane protein